MRPRRSVSVASLIPEIPGISVHSRLGLGLDVATTEKETSNPSALALMDMVNLDFIARFIIRWKTSNPEVTFAIIAAVLNQLSDFRVRKLCIDATSEKFFAAEVKRRLAGTLPVDLIVSSESVEYLGEKMSVKAFLGNQLVNEMEDGHVILPDCAWVRDDFRLVKRDRGSFVTEIDASGGHGDVFDAVKLGVHACKGPGGPAQGGAARVGTFGQQSQHRQLKNPLARLFNRSGGRVNV